MNLFQRFSNVPGSRFLLSPKYKTLYNLVSTISLMRFRVLEGVAILISNGAIL